MSYLKQKCTTPGCTIQFIPSGGRSICLICEDKGIQDSVLSELKKRQEQTFICKECEKTAYPCADLSSEHQEKDQCYECFVVKRWKLNNEKNQLSSILPSAPGGPIEKKEEKETKEKTIQIFVKSMTGTTVSVAIKEYGLIYDIALAIKKVHDVPLGAYKLIFAGKLLKFHESISFYNIQYESTVHLISMLRGS